MTVQTILDKLFHRCALGIAREGEAFVSSETDPAEPFQSMHNEIMELALYVTWSLIIIVFIAVLTQFS